MQDELLMIRVSQRLVEKVKKKLDCHPDTPAVYAVDQALRAFVKGEGKQA